MNTLEVSTKILTDLVQFFSVRDRYLTIGVGIRSVRQGEGAAVLCCS